MGPTGVMSSEVNFSFIPTIDSVFDLGSPDHRFRDIYLSSNSIYIDNVKINVDESGNLIILDQSTNNVSTIGNGVLNLTDGSGNLITLNNTGLYLTTYTGGTGIVTQITGGGTSGTGGTGPTGPAGPTGTFSPRYNTSISRYNQFGITYIPI
jgi:hypothetical protein